MREWVKFALKSIAVGLMGTLIVMIFFPQLGGETLIARLTEKLEANRDVVSYADAVRKAAPAVVSISTLSTAERTGRSQLGLGSGVLIDNLGHIVTNYHVIKNSREVLVLLTDGRRARARVIGSDPSTDLAVLQVDLQNSPFLDMYAAPAAAVGDVVLSIGNPYGYGQSVSMGIVSATDRAINNKSLEEFIQTDAFINPGSSGGALVNARGELVGISSAFLSENANGINFALPISLVQFVAKHIIRDGKVVRGWLGVTGGPLRPQVIQRLGIYPDGGILVTSVYPGSPADRAGVRKGDILLRVNGEAVGDVTRFIRWLSRMEPGTQLLLDILRLGRDGVHKKLNITVKLTVVQPLAMKP